MKISVCIPMYNENRVIAETARKLSAYMQANFEDYEIIFTKCRVIVMLYTCLLT